MTVLSRKHEAIEKLEKLIPIFYEAVLNGFNEYYRTNENQTFKYRPTTRANIIYDNIIHKLKKDLVREPGISFINKNKLLTLKVADKYLIKFKKLDDNHKSSNVKTRQNTMFLNQQVLFGLEQTITNLEVGYVLNPVETEINGVFIVCPKDDKSNEWEIDLDEFLMNKSRVTLFSRQEQEPKEKGEKTRFTAKKGKTDDGDTTKEQLG